MSNYSLLVLFHHTGQLAEDFLDNANANVFKSVPQFCPPFTNSLTHLTEAGALELLAEHLDRHYSGRPLESDVDTSGVQPEPSGFGPQILEHLAFFQATANYKMFCWTAKVSVISTLSICCISIGL